jgi:DNA-binding transcriptional ArsR family regulator
MEGLRASLTQRLLRFLLPTGIMALTIMMVMPAVAAADAPEVGMEGQLVVPDVSEWEETPLGGTEWTESAVMLAPLYLRVPEPQLLQNTTRSEIFTFVSHNPGATFSEIRASLGVATGTVQHHLRVLVRGSVLRRVRTGKYTRYYPCNHRVLAMGPSEERLVKSLAVEGSATKAELAHRLDMSRQLIHYHVERMAKKGLVEVDREGGVPRVRLGAPLS